MPGEPKQFPNQTVVPLCSQFMDTAKHWNLGLVLRQSKKINSQNQPVRRDFGKLLCGVRITYVRW